MANQGKSVRAQREALMAERRAEMWRMRADGCTQQQIGDHYGITQAAVSQQLAKAYIERPAEEVERWRAIELDKLDRAERAALGVMTRRHYLVSNGAIVTMYDEDASCEVFLQDDMPILRSLQVLLKIAQRRADLLGLDVPVKANVSSEMTVRYEIDGVDMSTLR